MKRSELNKIIQDNARFIESMNFRLPPFAFWTASEWAENLKDPRYNEIRDTMLGWDITDFGSGAFDKVGLLMFTIRNGSLTDPNYPKPYAEKLLISEEAQVTPFHYHIHKMEDIINRGGGNLLVQIYNRGADDELDKQSDLVIYRDGLREILPAGSIIRLENGESITLPPMQYHSFWGEPGHGKVLIGEVSKVNDDRIDNRFLEFVGRFPDIEEDTEPLYLMYPDYADMT